MLFIALAFVAQSAFALECENRESAPLVYECSNAQNVLCVTRSTYDKNTYSVVVGRHNGGGDGLSGLKAKETNKSFTIFKKEKALFFTTLYVNLKIDKRTNEANFRGFTRNLLEIGDGPHWTFNVEQQDFQCNRVTP
jgi:hypothetical protein